MAAVSYEDFMATALEYTNDMGDRHKKVEYTPLYGMKIRLAGLDYKIKYFRKIIPVDPSDGEYSKDCYTAGYSDLCDRIIGIFAYLSKQEHDFTLLHEILHCVMEACKTEEVFQEEDFIKPTSRILFDALLSVGMLRTAHNPSPKD